MIFPVLRRLYEWFFRIDWEQTYEPFDNDRCDETLLRGAWTNEGPGVQEGRCVREAGHAGECDVVWQEVSA